MRPDDGPSGSPRSIEGREALFLFVVLLFLAVVCIWPILTWRIHHFSTYTPDVVHSYPVRERRGTLYLTPAFGKFYVSLPWLWGGLLAATVLTGLLSSRKPASAKRPPDPSPPLEN
jgi:hypothetical protein